MNLGDFRQIMSTIFSAIFPTTQARRLGQVNSLAARSFNHTPMTHMRFYMPVGQSEDPHGRESASITEAGFVLDNIHSSYVGAHGWGMRGGNSSVDINGQETTRWHSDWRRLRLLSRDEASGFLKFALGLEAEFRSAQLLMIQEAISGVRDSLNVFGCGYGKTCALYAFSVYQFMVQLTRKHNDAEQRAALANRLAEKGFGATWMSEHD